MKDLKGKKKARARCYTEAKIRPIYCVTEFCLKDTNRIKPCNQYLNVSNACRLIQVRECNNADKAYSSSYDISGFCLNYLHASKILHKSCTVLRSLAV